MKHLKALGHLVLVEIPKVESTEKKSDAGIILSTGIAADERRQLENGSQTGIVAQIGPTAFADIGDGTVLVKVGEEIYFKRYAGIEYKNEEGKLFRMMNDSDIFGVFTEESK